MAVKAPSIIGVVLAAAALAAAALLYTPSMPASTITQIIIGSTRVQTEVADTPAERMQGLSGRQVLNEGEGMLFIFEEEGSPGFWMKDMLFSIDIVWADSSGNIISIAHEVSPSTYPQAFYPTEPTALYVLEVPAGFTKSHGIAEGTYLEFR